MAKKIIKYFVVNAKINEPKDSSQDYYSKVIDTWFERGYRIQLENSTSHYYVLQHKSENLINGQKVYYGVLSKYLNTEGLEFVNDDDELIEFEIPKNIKARENQYEFIFMPYCHRFAVIYSGKINEELTKKGAMFKKITEVIKMAFMQISDSPNVFIEIQKSDQVFNDIFDGQLLSFSLRVSYTNDDDLKDEAKKLMDEYLKEAKSSEIRTRMVANSNNGINTDATLPNGLLGLAKENGNVKAKIKRKSGKTETIDTAEFPERREAVLEQNDFSLAGVMQIINRFFSNKYGNNQ